MSELVRVASNGWLDIDIADDIAAGKQSGMHSTNNTTLSIYVLTLPHRAGSIPTPRSIMHLLPDLHPAHLLKVDLQADVILTPSLRRMVVPYRKVRRIFSLSTLQDLERLSSRWRTKLCLSRKLRTSWWSATAFLWLGTSRATAAHVCTLAGSDIRSSPAKEPRRKKHCTRNRRRTARRNAARA